MCAPNEASPQVQKGLHRPTSSHVAAAAAGDAVQALALLIVLHACAHAQIGTGGAQLHEKIALQGSGVGYILDTASGHLVNLYHIVQIGRLGYGGKWSKTPLALRMSLASGLAFGLVANAFHYLQDGSGDETSPLFMVFFALAGTLNLFSLMWGMRLVSGASAGRALATATVNLACLAAAPLALLLVGGGAASNLINQFFLNGHVFVFIAVTVEPVLRQAHAATGIRQFATGRLFMPALVACFLLEGTMVKALDIDAHVCVHACALGFVATLTSGLSAALSDGIKPKP